MAENRWTFQRAVKKVNTVLNSLKLEKAEDKTFIGKIERGFDFLGFHFGREGRVPSEKSVRKFAENIVLKLISSDSPETHIRVYGNRISRSMSVAYCTERIRETTTKGDLPIPEAVSAYIQRWFKWVKSMYEKETTVHIPATHLHE